MQVPPRRLPKILQRSDETVPQLKARIGEELRKKNIRILVVIDDIDRLTAEEIPQLFRVIKAVADFPNTIYLLAFDQGVAIQAIDKIQGVSKGAQYLEKIIQDAHEMPAPDRIELDRIFLRKLDIIFKDKPETLFDASLLMNLFADGIRFLIKTPRQSIRLINSLSVSYPAVTGEVAIADFVATEALRVFAPDVWHLIRNNPKMFVGGNEKLQGDKDKNELQAFHDNWTKDLKTGERDAVIYMVGELFPKTPFRNFNTIYGSDAEREWKIQRRVCSDAVFFLYFNSALPKSELSHAEIRLLIDNLENREVLKARLSDLGKEVDEQGVTRAERALLALRDYASSGLKTTGIQTLIGVLFDIGDVLSTNDFHRNIRWFGSSGGDSSIGGVARSFASRLSQQERFDLYHRLFSENKALYTMSNRLLTFMHENGEDGGQVGSPEQNRSVTKAQVYTLRNILTRRIRDAAIQGDLSNNWQGFQLLLRWAAWSDGAEVREYVAAKIKSDEQLLTLLEASMGYNFSQSWDSRILNKTARLDPEWLKPLLDPDTIIERVRDLSKRETLTQMQAVALRCFMTEFKMRQDGKDPSNLFTDIPGG